MPDSPMRGCDDWKMAALLEWGTKIMLRNHASLFQRCHIVDLDLDLGSGLRSLVVVSAGSVQDERVG